MALQCYLYGNFAATLAGIYLHIPFCRQACTYCNFHFSTSFRLKDDILQAMMNELDMQQHYLHGAPIETIYLGGGTPSLLSADEINRLLDHIFQHYPVHKLLECTLEANPDDLTLPYLRALRHTPISRLSMGVQSFKEADLQYMHRAHTAQQADYAIKAAQDAGFDNMSVDLIYGTPGLTDADWQRNLAMISQLQIPHFSAYALTVEEGTALHHAITKKKSQPVDPDQAAGQFQILTAQAALMGYDHYEISNLALPGHYAVHNTNYWRGKHYLGIGPSAHSFDGVSRRWNVANNALYANSILQHHQLQYEEEQLTRLQHLNEYIMTSIRTMWGCDLDKIAREWSSAYVDIIEKASMRYRENGQLTLEGRKLMLTPTGKLFADGIAGDLFIDELQ